MIKNLSWVEGVNYCKTGRKLSCDGEYQHWAERMGYSDINLSEIDEVTVRLAGEEESDAFGIWLNSQNGHAPNWWHHHGFSDSRQMDLVVSINFQRICNWVKRHQGK